MRGKTVKNVKATVNFPISSLGDMRLTEDQLKAGDALVVALRNKEEATELKEKLESSYTDEQKGVIASFGKTNHTQTVVTEIDLGHFIFDIFNNCFELPKAPLSQKRALERTMAYAKELEKEEFVIPDEVYTIVKTALEDDDLWDVENDKSKLSFFVWYTKTDEKKNYMQINIRGVVFYNGVINAAIEAFKDGDAPVEKE